MLGSMLKFTNYYPCYNCHLVLSHDVSTVVEQYLQAFQMASLCREVEGSALTLENEHRDGREGGWVGSGGVWEWGVAHRGSTDVFNDGHINGNCEDISNGRVREDECMTHSR